MDETFVRIAGRWMYLFRAVDSGGQTVDFYLSETRDREAAKCFCDERWLIPTTRTDTWFAREPTAKLSRSRASRVLASSSTLRRRDSSSIRMAAG